MVEWFRALDLKSGGPWIKSSSLLLSRWLTVLCETKRYETKRNGTLQNGTLRNLNCYPGPKVFLLIHVSSLFGNLRCEALIEVPSQKERKPLVKIVENLTFMLALYLTLSN